MSRRAHERPTAEPTAPAFAYRSRTQIAAWAATGASNDEIAAELEFSSATVRTHIGRAMIKLSARVCTRLDVFTIQSGLTVCGSLFS